MNHLPFTCLGICMMLLSLGCTPEKKEPLRIGTNAWPGYEFLHLAQAKGYFEESGTSVRLVEFSSLADCRRAYERGQIDGMATTVIEVLQARDQSSRSPQIVKVVDYSDGADVILGRPGITSSADLKGKRVGVELASVGVYVLARGLEQAGLDMTSVETVSLDPLSMEEALKQGKIDAAVSYPPFSIRLLHEPGITTLFSTKTVPGEVVDVIAIEEDLCKTRSKDVAAMIRSFDRAVAYSKQNPDDAYAIMAARQGITKSEFAETLTNGITLVSEHEQADFLMPGGKLEQVIDRSDKILHETGQLAGPSRKSGVIQPCFIHQK